jgi:hypothetical protein
VGGAGLDELLFRKAEASDMSGVHMEGILELAFGFAGLDRYQLPILICGVLSKFRVFLFLIRFIFILYQFILLFETTKISQKKKGNHS